MTKFIVVVLALFAIIQVEDVESAPQSQISCSVAGLQTDLQKTMMKCMMHNPGLMLQIMENMQKPSKMESFGFVCNNRNEMANLMNCMMQEFEQCLPSEAKDMVMKVLPDQKRWQEIFKLVCDNKEILNDQCMTPQDSQEFMTCYMSKIQSLSTLASSMTSLSSINPLLCKVIRSDEQCFKDHAGSCSSDFINMVTQLIEMVFKVSDCPAGVADIDTKFGSALSSIMLQGHPLHFKPQGEARYKTVHGN